MTDVYKYIKETGQIDLGVVQLVHSISITGLLSSLAGSCTLLLPTSPFLYSLSISSNKVFLAIF